MNVGEVGRYGHADLPFGVCGGWWRTMRERGSSGRTLTTAAQRRRPLFQRRPRLQPDVSALPRAALHSRPASLRSDASPDLAMPFAARPVLAKGRSPQVPVSAEGSKPLVALTSDHRPGGSVRRDRQWARPCWGGLVRTERSCGPLAPPRGAGRASALRGRLGVPSGRRQSLCARAG